MFIITFLRGFPLPETLKNSYSYFPVFGFSYFIYLIFLFLKKSSKSPQNLLEKSVSEEVSSLKLKGPRVE